jgi:hypothetical protein
MKTLQELKSLSEAERINELTKGSAQDQGAVSERQRMHAALDRLLDAVYKRRSCAGDRQR